MEQNYSETRTSSQLFNPDSMLMAQVVGQDYELLLIDMLLKSTFDKAKEVI